jgi:hypothetical protein
MTLEEEIKQLTRSGLRKTMMLAAGTFLRSKRFKSWDAEKQYRYTERVGMIDGAGVKITLEAHIIACREIGEPAYAPFK